MAATADSLEDVETVTKDLSFPVAYGVSRDLADKLGAWWDEKRNFIQPTEFLLSNQGTIISSTYSSSPLGRSDPEEALVLLGYLEKSKR